MGRRIREELKQTRPFASLEEEVAVEVHRTAQVLMRWLVEELKPSSITPSQYNVLRILRGSSPQPLSATEICSRMVTYDPDLTRLLDRLETAGMVRKERDAKDRRVVNVHITKLGRDTVESAMEAARARLHEELGGIGKARLEQLADLLERVRGNTP
jgi:DNA-binding MarR family transcriptional regulator